MDGITSKCRPILRDHRQPQICCGAARCRVLPSERRLHSVSDQTEGGGRRLAKWLAVRLEDDRQDIGLLVPFAGHRGEAAGNMRNLKQFDWGAECDRQIWHTEIIRIAALQLVQELWVSLLKEGPSMTPSDLATEIAAIEEIQSYFDAGKSREAIAEVASLVNLRAERAMVRARQQLQAG